MYIFSCTVPYTYHIRPTCMDILQCNAMQCMGIYNIYTQYIYMSTCLQSGGRGGQGHRGGRAGGGGPREGPPAGRLPHARRRPRGQRR
jgi:hypothetical protein